VLELRQPELLFVPKKTSLFRKKKSIGAAYRPDKGNNENFLAQAMENGYKERLSFYRNR